MAVKKYKRSNLLIIRLSSASLSGSPPTLTVGGFIGIKQNVMKKPLFTEIRREVIKENADVRIIYSIYLFMLLMIRNRPRFKFESSKIYYILAIIPTIEIYLMPKGLWSDGNDGFAVSFRWLYWAAGIRVYRVKK